MPPIATTMTELSQALSRLRASSARIALVPTMGALHAGHVALCQLARQHADAVVVSIFVNPAQFAPHEDFDRYPRTLAADQAKVAGAGVSLIWAPDPALMYPSGFATRIEVAGPALGLETDFRPHFFSGVATVCCKLFTQVRPDVAIFGEKDFQQLAVVRRMAADLDLGLEIVGAPTQRERDGLALSSRNAYLSREERLIAPAMHRSLEVCRDALESGTPIGQAEEQGRHALLSKRFGKVDYFCVRDAASLGVPANGPRRILAAAWLGATRLIDNIAA